jgi:hypothetical protein
MMSDSLPGKGLFGWLGRQVGYVKKAIHVVPAKPMAITPCAQPSAENPPPVLYQNQKIEEVEHPTQPGVKLRRTTIDQVIVDSASKIPKPD